MIETFFFVPLTNKKFLKKAPELEVDNIVYDLEDAIKESDIKEAYTNIQSIQILSNTFVRPRIKNDIKKDFNLLENLVQSGFRNFIVPKTKNISDVELVVKSLDELQVTYTLVLLIENPEILFNLQKILESYLDKILGIGLGSHDYCNEMEAIHEYKSYQFAHDYILNLAKMFKIKAIDIASMNIQNESAFKKETKIAFNKGYRAKFILHPKQLDYLLHIEYFSESEIDFAKKVASKIDLNEEFNAINVDGQILEAPHINRIKEILKYSGYEFK